MMGNSTVLQKTAESVTLLNQSSQQITGNLHLSRRRIMLLLLLDYIAISSVIHSFIHSFILPHCHCHHSHVQVQINKQGNDAKLLYIIHHPGIVCMHAHTYSL